MTRGTFFIAVQLWLGRFFLCASGAFGGRQAKEIAKRCHKMGKDLLSFEHKTVFSRRRKSKPETGAEHE